MQRRLQIPQESITSSKSCMYVPHSGISNQHRNHIEKQTGYMLKYIIHYTVYTLYTLPSGYF